MVPLLTPLQEKEHGSPQKTAPGVDDDSVLYYGPCIDTLTGLTLCELQVLADVTLQTCYLKSASGRYRVSSAYFLYTLPFILY